MEKLLLEEKKIEINGYKLLSELGRGSFSKVFKVKKQNEIYAMKVLEKGKFKKDVLKQYVNTEVEVTKKLQSQNIVKLYENFETRLNYYLILEYCNQGTLMDYINQKSPSEQECLKIFCQILNGFKEIHKMRFLHRDIKTENILVNKGVFKIADFGLAKNQSIGETYCGTPCYMAPEIIQKQPHSYKADLWSLGVMLYYMLYKKYPFSNRFKRYQEIETKCIPSFDLQSNLILQGVNRKATPELQDLFKRIFIINTSRRISFQDLYDMQFLQRFINKEELIKAKVEYSQVEEKQPQNSNLDNYSEGSYVKSGTHKISKDLIQNIIEEDQFEGDEEEENIVQPSLQQQDSECNLDLSEQQEGKVSKFAFNGYYIAQSELNSEGSQVFYLGPKMFDNFNPSSKINEKMENIQQVEPDMEEISNTMRKALIMIGKMEFEESEYLVEQFEKYNYDISKYNFLVDLLKFIEKLCLTPITYNIVFYLLNKTILIYALIIRDSLLEKNNIYKIEKFEAFLNSDQYSIIVDKIELDIQQRNRDFFKTLQNIQIEKDIKDPLLMKMITSHVEERNFDGDFRIATRKVLDAVFKHCLNMAKNAKTQEQKITFLKGGLSCLFFMLSNGILEKNTFSKSIYQANIYIQNEYPDLWKLFLTIDKSQDKLLLENFIFNIIEKSYNQAVYQQIRQYY